MTKRMIDADALEKLFEWLDNEIAMDNKIYKINLEAGYAKQPSLESTLYNKKRFLQKINELATPVPEPQESIFDADGWCWDLSLVDNNEEYHFLIESHRECVGYKTTNKKSYYQIIGLTWFIQENLEENECLGDKIIAW